MNVLKDDVQRHTMQLEETNGEGTVSCSLSPLSAQEIQAVAGGPETTVGTGIQPP